MKKLLFTSKKSLLTAFMLVVGCIGFASYIQASRTVTFTGASTNFATKEDVTINKTSGSQSAIISCLDASNVDYLKSDASAAYLNITLALSTERIDSINIIWRSASSGPYIPVIFGESATIGSVSSTSNVVTATNGGWVNTATIASSGATSCPNGHIVKFPREVTVKSLWMGRGFSLNPADGYTTNTIYPTFYARINSATGIYNSYIGINASNFIGEVTLYISNILVTTPLTAPTIGTATSVTATGFTANWTDIDNESSYTVKVYQGANEVVSARQTGVTGNSVAISGLTANTSYTYKVTAIGDGITYGNSTESTASAAVKTLNTAKAITSFTLLSLTGVIDQNAKTITLEVPYSADLSSPLTPTVAVSEFATLVTSGAQQFTAGTAKTFTVQAEDGTTQDYAVTVNKAAANQNADLSALGVSLGTLSPAFSADGLTYTVQLPFSNTTIPTVNATKGNSLASVVINNAAALPGSATVVVTAEDVAISKTYTINFTKAAASQNADLSTLGVSLGTLSPAFSANGLTYTVQLPFANTTVPTVNANKADNLANIVINNATAVPGSATVVVTAEDTNISKTYTISFSKLPASTACAITGFSINGVTGVVNETAGTITVTLGGLSTDVTALVPTISKSPLATISPASGVAQNFTTPKDYTVTAENTSVSKVYRVTVVLVNDSYAGPFPYISDMTSSYQVPFWIKGYETYEGTRTIEGACKVATGTIRLGAQSSVYNQLKVKVANCGTFKVGMSADASRTIKLSNNKNSTIASTTLFANTCKSLTLNVNSNTETELYVDILAGSGGTNIYSIEITAYGTAGVEQIETISSVVAQEDKLVVNSDVGAVVKVLSVNGSTLYQGILSSAQSELPIVLSKGLYLVIVNGETHKVLVK